VTRYWIRVVIALAICAVSVVGVDWGIYHLVRTGSCGSSSTYISARPCPPGTGGHIMALIWGIFGGLIGAGIWATRGKRGRPSAIPLGLILWSLLFITLPLSIGFAAYGPAASGDAGGKTVAVVLGLVFIPMGLAPLPFAFGWRRKRSRAAQLASTGERCRGVVVSVDDTGVTINGNPRVKMTVRAEPPGESPFTIEKTATVPRVRIPRPGDACVVFYDPANRAEANGITFDPVPGFAAAAPAPTPTVAPDDEEDPLEKIAKLGELRDKGLITTEEFEDQKKRLLSEI
jgi:hypothetical protein